jgi:hypothetical protein
MSELLQELHKLAKPYLIPASGHVWYACASRVVPKALVAGGWPPRFHEQRLTAARPTWIISGYGTTSTEGRVNVDVSEYVEVPECAPIGYDDHWGPAIIDAHPVFLATHHSESPALLSTKVNATAHEEGSWSYKNLLDGNFYPSGSVEYKITVTVDAWNLNSEPLAIDFSWLCIAEGAMRWKPV